MSTPVGTIEALGDGCFKWCIAGVFFGWRVTHSPSFTYRGYSFNLVHQSGCDDGIRSSFKSSVAATPDSAGVYPKATFQLHLQSPQENTPVPDLPHTFSTTHTFSAAASECTFRLDKSSNVTDRARHAELCATLTFIQLEWPTAALEVQGLQLTDSLPLQLAAAPSGAAFFGSEELSDCTVVAGGQTLFCHKLVLSMASSVFRAMFRSGMGESSSSRVEVRDATPEAVTMLLQAICGQEVAVSLQHLVQLAHLADQYQTTALTEAIIQAVNDRPIVAQALAELLPAAVAAGGTERLVDCPLEQMVSQISSISQAPDAFQQWSPQVVQLLVKAAGGRAVYEALQVAAAWINADKQQRQHHFASLLAHLQLPKLSMAELRQLDAQPEVMELPGLGVALFRVMLKK